MNKIFSLELDGCEATNEDTERQTAVIKVEVDINGSLKDDSINEVCHVKPPSENNGGVDTETSKVEEDLNVSSEEAIYTETIDETNVDQPKISVAATLPSSGVDELCIQYENGTIEELATPIDLVVDVSNYIDEPEDVDVSDIFQFL